MEVLIMQRGQWVPVDTSHLVFSASPSGGVRVTIGKPPRCLNVQLPPSDIADIARIVPAVIAAAKGG